MWIMMIIMKKVVQILDVPKFWMFLPEKDFVMEIDRYYLLESGILVILKHPPHNCISSGCPIP